MSVRGIFDRLYADQPDPWNLATSDYERRKRAILLASLPRRRYVRAFEPGCATGELTAALVRRCDSVSAWDVADAAVRQARARVGSGTVEVHRGEVPGDWPEGEFDLVVLSEFLYYLEGPARKAVADRTLASLAAGGDVVAVHWRAPFAEAAAPGDVVHAELVERLAAAGQRRTVEHVEERFLLSVLTSSGKGGSR